MPIKFKFLSIIIIFGILITSVEAGNEQIQRLIQQGNFEEALAMVEERLSKNPAEIQVLFLKGLTLASMNRLKEAEAVFVALTENHPELPEPFNNLAVIYASSGEYDKDIFRARLHIKAIIPIVRRLINKDIYLTDLILPQYKILIYF